MILRSAALILILAASANAQTRDGRRPFEIADNSFLVEEAFNQEAGVFQNILLFQRPHGREWTLEFTQEWPVFSQRHQFSFTVPLEAVKPPLAEDYDVARGTIGLNYRYQLTFEEGSGVAVSPRVSLLIPRADEDLGVQFNLPVSKQFANVYAHANAGFTADGDTRFHVAGSLIYRAWPMVHLMLESVYRIDEHDTLNGREDGWLVSPGARAGFNFGDQQLVVGAAVPIGLLNDYDTQDFIAYISWELPFMRR
ncbi:MAG TPA: hypothetical protein VGC44_05075 [Longimicrobiales bacterium]